MPKACKSERHDSFSRPGLRLRNSRDCDISIELKSGNVRADNGTHYCYERNGGGNDSRRVRCWSEERTVRTVHNSTCRVITGVPLFNK